MQIRSQQTVADLLGGFSYFLEGRAEIALQRPQVADAAFGKMVERTFEYPQLGLKVAGELFALHRPAFARDVLVRLQEELAGDVNYWTALFATADTLKDCDLMLHAARQAYELLPTNPAVMNNYAAVLLILRQSPEGRQSSEPAVIREALGLLVKRQCTLQQQLGRKVSVVGRSRKCDRGCSEVGAARLRAERRKVGDRGSGSTREPLRLRPQ